MIDPRSRSKKVLKNILTTINKKPVEDLVQNLILL